MDRLQFSGVPGSREVIRRIAAETDTILLGFSLGKDSIASWLACRPHFRRIIPFYMYLVPDLDFVERSLHYYEKAFDTRIVRVPHPSLYRMLRNLTFQPPQRCAIIEAADLYPFSYWQLPGWIAEDFSEPEIWTAVGVRAADSIQRRVSLKTHGPISRNRKTFFPVWDWRKAELIETIRAHKLLLPPDYMAFGRSFDGIDFRFLSRIKDLWPADYEKIVELFPLAELELFRAGLSKERCPCQP